MCIKGYSQKSEKTTQRQPNPKKISANHISDKSLVSRIRKKLAAQQEKKNSPAVPQCVQRITIWPSNTTTRYIPEETENPCSNKNLYTNVYTRMLHNSLKVDQPKCASTGEQINKMWYTYTMKYYSLIKRNEVLIYASTDTLKTLNNERNLSQK